MKPKANAPAKPDHALPAAEWLPILDAAGITPQSLADAKSPHARAIKLGQWLRAKVGRELPVCAGAGLVWDTWVLHRLAGRGRDDPVERGHRRPVAEAVEAGPLEGGPAARRGVPPWPVGLLVDGLRLGPPLGRDAGVGRGPHRRSPRWKGRPRRGRVRAGRRPARGRVGTPGPGGVHRPGRGSSRRATRQSRFMAPSPGDVTGELWGTAGAAGRTGDADRPGPAGQAELVICDSTIERTFGWFNRYRRRSKDYEHNPKSSEAWIDIATIHRMSRFDLPDKNEDDDLMRHPPKAVKP